MDTVVDRLLRRPSPPPEVVELRDRVEAALAERVELFDATEGYAVDGAYSFPCCCGPGLM